MSYRAQALDKCREHSTSEQPFCLRSVSEYIVFVFNELLQEEMIKDMLGRIKEFHVKFIEKYS